jgi:hypothetical protein
MDLDVEEASMGEQPIVPLVLKAVALAMGVAVVVIGILGTGSPPAMIMMLGIGLFCIALQGLMGK